MYCAVCSESCEPTTSTSQPQRDGSLSMDLEDDIGVAGGQPSAPPTALRKVVLPAQQNGQSRSDCTGHTEEIGLWALIGGTISFPILILFNFAVLIVMVAVSLALLSLLLVGFAIAFSITLGILIVWAVVKRNSSSDSPFASPSRPYLQKPLRSEAGAIRVLELLPGERDAVISCKLHSVLWDEAEYKALSYTWGNPASWTSHFIMLDGRHFTTTPALERALKALRFVDRPLRIWIDAVCINQFDINEKAQQVAGMGSVFNHAVQVVVFLDVTTSDPSVWSSIGSLFNSVNGCASLDHARIMTLVNALTTEEVNALILVTQQSWWTRVWVIQEVAAGRKVMVQCGAYILDWDDLSMVIIESQSIRKLQVPTRIILFVQRVQRLRNSEEDIPYGLLSHLYQFRESQATIARDRIYALMNLVKGKEHMLQIAVTYKGAEEALYTEVLRQAISTYQTLNALVGLEADRHDSWDILRYFIPGYRTSSWVYCWGLHHSKSQRQSLWNGGLSFPAVDSTDMFSASGDCAAISSLDCPDPQVLCVCGFECDDITAISRVYNFHTNVATKMKILQQWSNFVRDHDRPEEGQAQCGTFVDTVTAGTLATGRSSYGLEVFQRPENLAKLDMVAHGRRLFSTRKGEIGLGHANSRVNDIICILLGAAVPYILRQGRHDGPGVFHSTPDVCAGGCKRKPHRLCCFPNLHCVIGQAYVRPLMQYRGDLKDDIESGRRRIVEYFLE